jgi:hypothetical protein
MCDQISVSELGMRFLPRVQGMVLIDTSNCISVRHMHEYGHKYTPSGGFDPFKLIALLRIEFILLPSVYHHHLCENNSCDSKCRRLEIPDKSLIYSKSQLLKPDEANGSHMFRSRIRNHYRPPRAAHLLQKKEHCLLECLWLMMMITLPRIKLPNVPKLSERYA